MPLGEESRDIWQRKVSDRGGGEPFAQTGRAGVPDNTTGEDHTAGGICGCEGLDESRDLTTEVKIANFIHAVQEDHDFASIEVGGKKILGYENPFSV